MSIGDRGERERRVSDLVGDVQCVVVRCEADVRLLPAVGAKGQVQRTERRLRLVVRTG